ncbi:MAG: ABC transporter, partial [Clostridium sp.]
FINTVCDYIIEIKNNKIEEFNGNYKKYIEYKANSNIKSISKKNNEEILLLENEMSRIISMLCTESNDNKKVEYEEDYQLILAKLKVLRNS